jgi:ParB family chromosome partitioning protein
MMNETPAPAIEMIPVDLISVVNPRVRNKRNFKEIVANIAELGLKKPITVTRRQHADGFRYELVCGQGRLEAFQTLGQSEIPALVIDASGEDCLVMSLVENVARRQHRAIDLLHDIEGLKRRGYNEAEIARKTGLTLDYAKGILRLLETREHRLLRAVEAGQIPVSVAVEIAESDDEGVQRVLQQAYEKNVLRGRKFLAVKRLIERRRRMGRRLRTPDQRRDRTLSLNGLLRTYQEDTDKKRLLVRKADATRDRLIFVVEALRKLVADEHFVTLLRAEGLDTLPRNIGDRLQSGIRS